MAPDLRVLNAPSQSQLRFARSPNGETYLAQQLLRFPYHITRVHRATARNPRADLCLQALGGGLVEGDNICLGVDLGPDARVRITTQSSNKIHSMRGGQATHKTHLNVAPGAWLDYRPRPLILFPDSDSTNLTRITLHPGAMATVVDSFYPYDPAASGHQPAAFTNTVEVVDPDGRLLVRDAIAATAADFQRSRNPGGLPCQCGIFLLGRIENTTVLTGFRHRASNADLSCSRLPNNVGWCLRGFVSGAEVLLDVVDQLLGRVGLAAFPEGHL
jgi:urease accessory protein UreH